MLSRSLTTSALRHTRLVATVGPRCSLATQAGGASGGKAKTAVKAPSAAGGDDKKAASERQKQKDSALEQALQAQGRAMKAKTVEEIQTSMKGKNLLQFIQDEAILDMGMMQRRTWLDRKSPECLRPGYAVEVQAVSSKSLRKRYTYLGTIIAIRRKGLASTFTIRNTILDEGVEMTFPFFSPLLMSVRILNKDLKVRRAKLYYMRHDEKKDVLINESTFATVAATKGTA